MGVILGLHKQRDERKSFAPVRNVTSLGLFGLLIEQALKQLISLALFQTAGLESVIKCSRRHLLAQVPVTHPASLEIPWSRGVL